MKKFIASVIVCGFAVAMVACGGGKKAEEAAAQAKADSIRTADSIAAAAAVVVDSAAVAVDSAAVK
ncbi:MAG: hypothetical protein IM574_10840 [Cytophagales bacterium]|jgi:hypothetical protein|nr:hypothetical protein [Cytophagales bacterium]MCE2895965.1 hypothetical protein [Flammeovirgaceae bacterium]MCA6365922.1 hypothetical protein [Cytophagales bacterium]MCA6371318.1 hypothetical protein [Cytophagales bacterium]MCA6374915.1 hypothetical protein [Cytophagales bacterium]